MSGTPKKWKLPAVFCSPLATQYEGQTDLRHSHNYLAIWFLSIAAWIPHLVQASQSLEAEQGWPWSVLGWEAAKEDNSNCAEEGNGKWPLLISCLQYLMISITMSWLHNDSIFFMKKINFSLSLDMKKLFYPEPSRHTSAMSTKAIRSLPGSLIIPKLNGDIKVILILKGLNKYIPS